MGRSRVEATGVRSSSLVARNLLLALCLLAAEGLWGQTRTDTTELTNLVPASVAIPSDGVVVTLLGRGFRSGQSLVSSDPSVTVLAFQVASSDVALAVLRVLPGAPAGRARLDIRDPFGHGTEWQDRIPQLTLVPSGSLSAPLSVQAAAIVSPAPGTLLAPDSPLMVRGTLSTSGSGVIVGRFLLDGMPFDSFTAVAGGGAPVGVSARIPVPYTGAGTHDLQVEVLSPQHVLSGAVRIIGTDESRTALALLGPGTGASASDPPLFRWTFVPGAAGYEIALTPRGSNGSRYRWRSYTSEFRPAPAEWAAVEPGSYHWTVRAVFPGDVPGAPAPSRALFVGGAAVELRLSPAAPGPRPGTLWLSWEGGLQGTLYRLQFARAGQPLFEALTRQPRYLLRLPVSAETLDVTLTVLGPDGRPLGPPVHGTTAGPRSEKFVGPAVHFTAGPVAVTGVAPAEGSTVNLSHPPISARWQGAVNPHDVLLFLDATDVTAMATIQPGGLTYDPVMALTEGSHTVRLSLGTAESSWTFSVTGGGEEEKGGGETAPGPADVQGGMDASAEATPTGSWTLQAAGTFTDVSGSGPGEEDVLRATLSGQSDLGYNDAFFKSTADASWRHDFQNPYRTVNESRSWLLSGGIGGERLSVDGQAGYGAAEILAGSQFLSTGLTRGAGQLRAQTPIGGFGAYATFDDRIPGLGSATGGGDLRVKAASYSLPLPSENFTVRLMGLWSDGDASSYSPATSGRVLGALGTFHFSPAFSLYVEAARSSQTLAGSASTRGNAFCLGFSGTAVGLTYTLDLRRVEGSFGNPANPGYNAGGVPDRQGGDLGLSRTFGKLAATFHFQYAKDGVGGAGTLPSARHWQAQFGLTHPVGKSATAALNLNSTRDRGGEDLSMGLPGVRRNQDGLALSFTQRVSRLSFAEVYTFQRVRDSLNPSTAVDLDSLVLSAGGSITPNTGLAATASLSRTDLPFGAGRTDIAVVSVSPSWTLPGAHVTFMPQYLYSRTRSDAGTADSRTDQYGLTVQWTPAFWRSFLALQASALWTDHSGLSVFQQGGTDHRYFLSVSFRWEGGRGALNDRLGPPAAPAGMGFLNPVARPMGSAVPSSSALPFSPFTAPRF